MQKNKILKKVEHIHIVQMVYFFDIPNDYDENSDDCSDEFDEELLLELEENRKLNIITKFKEYISKEPEFYGINAISGFEIMKIIENNTVKKCKTTVSLEALDAFDDLYKELYGNQMSHAFYLYKINEMFRKMYV